MKEQTINALEAFLRELSAYVRTLDMAGTGGDLQDSIHDLRCALQEEKVFE